MWAQPLGCGNFYGVTDLYRQLTSDLPDGTDEEALHDALRQRQDELDAVVSELKVRRAELIAKWHADGKSLAKIAEERGYGTYQRVQKVLAQTAEARERRR